MNISDIIGIYVQPAAKTCCYHGQWSSSLRQHKNKPIQMIAEELLLNCVTETI